MTAGLAIGVGHRLGTGLLVTAAVLAGQLSIGWGNDWLDRERDRRAGRVDKPVAGGLIAARTVRRAAVLAAVSCVALSLASGPPGLLHLAAVGSGWGYNLGLKSTPASVLPFAVSFGLLPAYVVAAVSGPGSAPAWLIAAAALLGSGAHFANVLPDLADDEAAGVRGLGHRLGRRGCVLAAIILLGAAVLTLASGPPGPPGATAWVALGVSAAVGAGGFVRGQRPGSRAPFNAVLVLAVVAVALLLGSGTSLR